MGCKRIVTRYLVGLPTSLPIGSLLLLNQKIILPNSIPKPTLSQRLSQSRPVSDRVCRRQGSEDAGGACGFCGKSGHIRVLVRRLRSKLKPSSTLTLHGRMSLVDRLGWEES